MALAAPPQCAGPGCEKPAFRRGLCRGHLWQATKGRPLQPLAPRGQTLSQRLIAASEARAELDTAEDSDAAFERLTARLKRYGRSLAAERKPCLVRGCNRRRYTRGLCFKHRHDV